MSGQIKDAKDNKLPVETESEVPVEAEAVPVETGEQEPISADNDESIPYPDESGRDLHEDRSTISEEDRDGVPDKDVSKIPEAAEDTPAEEDGDSVPDKDVGKFPEAAEDTPADEAVDEAPEEKVSKPEKKKGVAHGMKYSTGFSGSDDDPEEDEEDYPEEPQKKRHPVLIWCGRILLVILCIAATFLMTFAYSLWSEYSGKRPYKGDTVQVEIPKGSSARDVAKILQDAGVIRYETTFLAKVMVMDKHGLKYGTYEINPGDTLGDIVKKIIEGDTAADTGQFIVPEGYSIEMIAAKLDKGNIISREEFLAAVDKAAEGFVYADQLPAKDKVRYPLQGYLFPETYALTEDTSADQFVNLMLTEFEKVFDEERQKKAKALGMSVEEVLIRASLVQKESQREEDYPMIAGVINNRLKKGMKLQFDSSVVYAMSEGMFGTDKVTYDDLKVKSPYNTYIVKGLPAGPICNPGLAAIDGVLNPVDHDYLYFRTDPSKDDGTNIFTRTYEEHMAVEGGSDQEEGSDIKKDNVEPAKDGTEQKKDNAEPAKDGTEQKKDNAEPAKDGTE